MIDSKDEVSDSSQPVFVVITSRYGDFDDSNPLLFGALLDDLCRL
ncbi:hypothetical protein ACJCHP_001674 [Enterobacter asburiae]